MHPFSLNVRGRLIDLSSPKIMGIINVTPDSFHEGSRVQTMEAILSKARLMIDEGATFLDLGGYSSRPGATDIPEEEEIKRVIEPIKEIRNQFPGTIISIDTFRSKVAGCAIEAGADIVNDISAGHIDPKITDVVAENKVPYVIMHMRGNPQTMKDLTIHNNLLLEIQKYFAERLDFLQKKGVLDLIVDPGFGFSKTRDQNFDLLSELELLQSLNRPLLVGISRKSMIHKFLGIDVQDSLNGTTTLNTVALSKGANILRVHDVKQAFEAARLIGRLN